MFPHSTRASGHTHTDMQDVDGQSWKDRRTTALPSRLSTRYSKITEGERRNQQKTSLRSGGRGRAFQRGSSVVPLLGKSLFISLRPHTGIAAASGECNADPGRMKSAGYLPEPQRCTPYGVLVQDITYSLRSTPTDLSSDAGRRGQRQSRLLYLY